MNKDSKNDGIGYIVLGIIIYIFGILGIIASMIIGSIMLSAMIAIIPALIVAGLLLLVISATPYWVLFLVSWGILTLLVWIFK